MIAAARTMQPLPVRPVEPVVASLRTFQTNRTLPYPPRPVHPLPVPSPEPVELVDAIRATAVQRMLDRFDVQQPLPVIDPRS